ncbi:MAG: glutamate-5-semialdehyde dehydrogenase [Alphaproteobacteria bacterium]|nr:glutamate-5-semialdehyde dehydrogenase [Alphaproteobacteria bacterium]
MKWLEFMREMGAASRIALDQMNNITADQRTKALSRYAHLLRQQIPDIITSNQQDITAARTKNISHSQLDRLTLNTQRIDRIAIAVEEIARQPDPIGRVLAGWDRPNGLRIERVSVPLGTIGIIYESRPNVTADAAALCLRSGNAAILRCGSESFVSSQKIYQILVQALHETGLPENIIQFVPTTDREAVTAMLQLNDYLDVIIPRGGKSLVTKIQSESRVPVLGHLEGLCHTYIDADADPVMAKQVVLNAKMRRPGICGATETVLVDIAAQHMLLPIVQDLINAGCEIRGDATIQRMHPAVIPATEEDWRTEYLAPILSIRMVGGVEGAISHIRHYGTRHTEAIITQNLVTAQKFMQQVDAGIVMHNTSTQFADGGEFGMGAEIGISTSKLHARGPVGAEQLTSFKYLVYGKGQLRP